MAGNKTRGPTKTPTPTDRRGTDREKNSGDLCFTQDTDERFESIRDAILSRIESPTALDRALVDRLVTNLRLAEEASAMAEAEPFTKGSRGQLVEHPGFRIAARCDTYAIQASRQLEPVLVPITNDDPAGQLIELARAGNRGRFTSGEKPA